jgi:hypothetical protein
MAQLKRRWRRFRQLPVGQRFQIHHQEAQQQSRSKPAWQRVLQWLLIPVFVAIGIVLTFIPGPAILFFLFAAALLAAHSLAVARALDRAELATRAAWSKLRSRRNRRRRSAPPRPRESH